MDQLPWLGVRGWHVGLGGVKRRHLGQEPTEERDKELTSFSICLYQRREKTEKTMYNDLGTSQGKAVPCHVEGCAPKFGIQLVHSVLRSILKEWLTWASKRNKLINSRTAAIADLIPIVSLLKEGKTLLNHETRGPRICVNVG